jgi:hypothetical protein
VPVAQTLEEMLQTTGVRGVFLMSKGGELLASSMPAVTGGEKLTDMAKSISRFLDSLEASRQHVQELDLTFQEGRLIVRNLLSARLALVCQPHLNLPFLNLNLAPLIKRLNSEMKPEAASPKQGAAPGTAPAAEGPLLLGRLSEEGRAIVHAAREVGLLTCLVGTAGVALHCPEGKQLLPPPARAVLELVGRSSDADAFPKVFHQLGYDSLALFNQEHRRERLIFHNKTSAIWIDLHLDAYEGFHRLELLASLRPEEELLAPAELLLLCLQKAEATEANLREIMALLCDHELSSRPASEAIDAPRITSLCAEDWGWYRTATKNLDRLIFLGSWGGLPESPVLLDRIRRLREEIENCPKGARWQMRAAIGDTVRWYRVPTAVDGMPPLVPPAA